MAESLQDEMRRFAAMIEAPHTGVSLAHICRLLRWGADEIDRLRELPETVAAEYGRKIVEHDQKQLATLCLEAAADLIECRRLVRDYSYRLFGTSMEPREANLPDRLVQEAHRLDPESEKLLEFAYGIHLPSDKIVTETVTNTTTDEDREKFIEKLRASATEVKELQSVTFSRAKIMPKGVEYTPAFDEKQLATLLLRACGIIFDLTIHPRRGPDPIVKELLETAARLDPSATAPVDNNEVCALWEQTKGVKESERGGSSILDALEAYKAGFMSVNEMRQMFANLRPLTQKAIEAICERVAADPNVKVTTDTRTASEPPADDPQLPRGGFF